MKFLLILLSAVLTVSCTSWSSTQGDGASKPPEASLYDTDPALVGQKTVDLALEEAALSGQKTIIVLGANWCDDSRALAGWFETPRFKAMLQDNFVLRYVDAGRKDRNVDVAQRFGLETIEGVPTVFVMNREGTLLNLDTAPTWRNAASRSEDDIFEHFEAYTLSE